TTPWPSKKARPSCASARRSSGRAAGEAMFVLANLLFAAAQVIDYALWAYIWILIARVVISFVQVDTNNPIVRFVYGVTEPVLERVRARLPVVSGFDLSPVAVWLAEIFLQHFVVRSLFDLAMALRGAAGRHENSFRRGHSRPSAGGRAVFGRGSEARPRPSPRLRSRLAQVAAGRCSGYASCAGRPRRQNSDDSKSGGQG